MKGIVSSVSTVPLLCSITLILMWSQIAIRAQNSTQFQCAICGDNAEVTNPDGLVAVPPFIEVSCAELLEEVELRNITEEQCLEINLEAQGPCECLYSCPLCQDGKFTTNPAGIVSVPSQPNVTCRELADRSADGNISRAECFNLQPYVNGPCGCMEESQGAPGSPTGSPTFGPSPPCWTDLDEVAARIEAAAENRGTSIPSDIILCPNTVFTFGVTESENFTNVGGFKTIAPRSNAHWKCGEDGAVSNNCIFQDGEVAIVFVNFSAPTENVTFQGITFESQIISTFIGGAAGDVTFENCIWRNQTSVSPILSVWIPDFRRRHLAADPKLFAYLSHLSAQVPALQPMLDWTTEQHKDTELVRALQEENPNFLTTLTMNFKNSIFEDCSSQPDSEFVEPAIVKIFSGSTVLNFDHVTFRNNDYGDPKYHPITSAIMTDGPSLSIVNSCFEDNQFLGRATVLAVGFDDIVINNTFGTFDEGLVCNFLGSFPNSLAVANLEDYMCIEYDAKVCTAQDPEASAPQLSVAPGLPTSRPVSTPSLPSAESPHGGTEAPAAMPAGSGSSAAAGYRISFILLSIVPSLLASVHARS